MEILNGITVKEMQGILSPAGFASDIVHEEAGAVVLRVTIRSLTFLVVLQGEASKGRYSTAQCVIGFNDLFSVNQANDWNKQRRFVKTYVDDDSNPYLEMDFLTVGVTTQAVQSYLGLWLVSLGDFGEMFG